MEHLYRYEFLIGLSLFLFVSLLLFGCINEMITFFFLKKKKKKILLMYVVDKITIFFLFFLFSFSFLWLL
jgi:hypothetical protein